MPPPGPLPVAPSIAPPRRYPEEPFCVPDTTPVCDRVAVLDALADQGVAAPELRAFAAAVDARARALRDMVALGARGGDAAAAALLARDPAGALARLRALELLRAVQSLEYYPEPSGRDCYQGVRHTLRLRRGECKAMTVVYVAAARALGIPAAPVWITQTGQALNHVAASAAPSGRAEWADGSLRGAMFGESPYEALARLGGDAAARVCGPEAAARGACVPPAPAGQALVVGGWGGGSSGRPPGFPPLPRDVRASVLGSRAVAAARQLPFDWWGWDGLWGGWPPWFWPTYYPYLYQPYRALAAAPLAYGFYPLAGGGYAPPSGVTAVGLGSTFGYGPAPVTVGAAVL